MSEEPDTNRRPFRPAAGADPAPARQRARGGGGSTQTMLAARKHRLHGLRKRITTMVLVGFMAVWGVIFVQLVSGHDPALAHKKVSSVSLTSTNGSQPQSATGSTATGSTATGSTGSTATGSTGSTAAGSTATGSTGSTATGSTGSTATGSTGAATPLTTRQS